MIVVDWVEEQSSYVGVSWGSIIVIDKSVVGSGSCGDFIEPEKLIGWTHGSSWDCRFKESKIVRDGLFDQDIISEIISIDNFP